MKFNKFFKVGNNNCIHMYIECYTKKTILILLKTQQQQAYVDRFISQKLCLERQTF